MRQALNEHEIITFDKNQKRMLESRLVRPNWEIGDICFLRMPKEKNKSQFSPGSSKRMYKVDWFDRKLVYISDAHDRPFDPVRRDRLLY